MALYVKLSVGVNDAGCVDEHKVFAEDVTERIV
jgi:hypothetical protein